MASDSFNKKAKKGIKEANYEHFIVLQVIVAHYLFTRKESGVRIDLQVGTVHKEIIDNVTGRVEANVDYILHQVARGIDVNFLAGVDLSSDEEIQEDLVIF